jgi:transcription initiation factor TFIID subunit 5
MTGHTASVYSLAFSAESTLLVSGGADWTVRCWDVKGAGGLRKPSAATAGKDELGIETFVLNWRHASVSTETDERRRADLVHTLPTKRTPIVNVQFTSRNLCMVAGSYAPPEQRI